MKHILFSSLLRVLLLVFSWRSITTTSIMTENVIKLSAKTFTKYIATDKREICGTEIKTRMKESETFNRSSKSTQVLGIKRTGE